MRRVAHVYEPPGIIMRQSGKPRPASPSKITTACLQDELASDDGQLRRGEPQVRIWRAVPNPDGDNRQLYFFSSAGIFHPAPLYYRGHSMYHDIRAERGTSPLSKSPSMTPFILGRVQWGDSASTSQWAVYSISPSVPRILHFPSCSPPKSQLSG